MDELQNAGTARPSGTFQVFDSVLDTVGRGVEIYSSLRSPTSAAGRSDQTVPVPVTATPPDTTPGTVPPASIIAQQAKNGQDMRTIYIVGGALILAVAAFAILNRRRA